MVTRCAVLARTRILASFAEKTGSARQLAKQTLPTGRARTLTVRVGAVAAILAGAFVGTVVPVTPLRTSVFTVLSDET